jgi:hypothetical protein
MEFQYLSDSNARTILSAFQISPEELPGYQHLSRGTNSQALAESNNEYKLNAARDVGIRPLIAQFEDFINGDLFPLIDPELARISAVRLVGLDAETAEKESVRIQEDMVVHMTYNDVLERVEKDPLPKEMGGELPFNQQYLQNLASYVPFGAIQEHFLGFKGAAKDPSAAFIQNPMWFQWQQLQLEMKQMEAQAQAQQQAAAAGQPPPGEGGGEGPPGGEGGQPAPAPAQPQEAQEQPQGQSELGTGIDQLLEAMSKSEEILTKGESRLPASKRRLRTLQTVINRKIMEEWHNDKRKVFGAIVDITEKHAPRKDD